MMNWMHRQIEQNFMLFDIIIELELNLHYGGRVKTLYRIYSGILDIKLQWHLEDDGIPNNWCLSMILNIIRLLKGRIS